MNRNSPETHVDVYNRTLMAAVRQGYDTKPATHTVGGRTAAEIVERAEAIQLRDYEEWRSQLPQTTEPPPAKPEPGSLRRVYELFRTHPFGLYSELWHASEDTCECLDPQK